MSNCAPCNNATFISLVSEAITDDLGAISMYAQMAKMVDNLALEALFTGIVGDEYGHVRTWMTILALCEVNS
ncbi:MAG: hypothetical protein H6Q64_1351 [Firmicutes bacterium]|nr:hypothetical protein [Bacillota bacterium]